jgi:hypothetical protein
MKLLKGVVIARLSGSVQIELETGRKVVAAPPFKVGIREQVLIAWDYTNDCVGSITTAERLAAKETDEERVEVAQSEVFQSPWSEEVEGDLSDLDVPSEVGKPEGEEQESDERSFPIPMVEDVDLSDIVLLKDDIHIY